MNEKKNDADVIIVGAGPAGLSAATWCVELGLETILFEKEAEPGGQLLHIFNPVTNYIGIDAVNGRDLLGHFLHTFDKHKPGMHLAAEIVEIDATARTVVTASGESFTAGALIAATGVRRRRLNISGERSFMGKGIIDSGSNEKEKVRGKRVVIVGGGDAALENALILADYASRVYVVHRGSDLRARSEFAEKAFDHPKIEFRLETTVNSIEGGGEVEAVELTGKVGKIEKLAADVVLVRIGVEPNTEILLGKIELDAKGYILTDSNCQTNVPRVYAIGDAASPVSPTIAAAAGMGSVAAKAVKASLRNS